MAICPFATWNPSTVSSSSYTGGPFKIVHHTTEGPTASGAIAQFKKEGHFPHFTVDHERIYQHFDTARSARALANEAGGVQTNRDGALQIEVVGFAHLAKPISTLRNVARLCRWLEEVHDVPQAWPNGYPKVATPGGKNPGGHNRDAATRNSQGGHYGHCHVPENTHWDPGYTVEEVEFLMSSDGDSLAPPVHGRDDTPTFELSAPDWSNVQSTMPDHGDSGGD